MQIAESRVNATIKNCQKPSEISAAKLQNDCLPFCKTPAAATNACAKTPIYKMGGAGARAAWRIRIRSGPEGAQGVFNFKVGYLLFVCIYFIYVGTFRRNLVEL